MALNVKRCFHCKQIKHADSFYKKPVSRFAPMGLSSWCRECMLARTKRLWRDPAHRAKKRAYMSDPDVAARRRANRNARHAERLSSDPLYLLERRVRAGIRYTMSSKWRNRRRSKLEPLLGYTFAELRQHIERQFLPGMGWHNRNEWHIDHIVPIASFDIGEYGDAEFKRCWAITNLRPLWADENIRKRDAVLTLL